MNERPTDAEFEEGAHQRGIAKSYEYVMGEAMRARASEAEKDAQIEALAGLLGRLDEFWANNSPVHPGSEIVLEAEAFLRSVGRL